MVNKNPSPPLQILGAIGHPRYNEFSVLTNFILTGFHCILPCLYGSIYKHKPISTKLVQNLYDPKIMDEFDYESNWTQAT